MEEGLCERWRRNLVVGRVGGGVAVVGGWGRRLVGAEHLEETR